MASLLLVFGGGPTAQCHNHRNSVRFRECRGQDELDVRSRLDAVGVGGCDSGEVGPSRSTSPRYLSRAVSGREVLIRNATCPRAPSKTARQSPETTTAARTRLSRWLSLR